MGRQSSYEQAAIEAAKRARPEDTVSLPTVSPFWAKGGSATERGE